MSASWLSALEGARAGRYRYLLNDVEQPIAENWAVEDVDSEPHLWSERRAGDVRLSLSMPASTSGPRQGRTQLQWQQNSANVITAEYDLTTWCYSVTRSAGNLFPARWQSVTESPLVLAPLLRISAGAVVRTLLESDSSCVLVPRIDSPVEEDSLLSPSFEERQVKLLAREVLPVSGREWDSLCCEYRSSRYGPGTVFWITEAGLLLRYRWQQEEGQQWQVDLQLDE